MLGHCPSGVREGRIPGVGKPSFEREHAMRKHARLLMTISVVLLVLCARPAMSQTTIFTVPTADTVAKGDVYIEVAYLPQNPNSHGVDKLDVVIPRIVVGIGGNMEVGANGPIERSTFTTIPLINRPAFQAVRSDAFLEPNMKWKFVSNSSLGLAASVGGKLTMPVRENAVDDMHALFYSNISRRVVVGAYGPRFTIGPYAVIPGRSYWEGTKAGAIVGLEQPIHPRASLVADWFSGKNDLGAFTPGVSFALPASSSLKVGYRFGNDSYGSNKSNRYPYVSYGFKL